MTAIDPARPWTIITGDCMAVLKDMADGAVDHVIADPPYNKAAHQHGRLNCRAESSLPITFDPMTEFGICHSWTRVALRWALAFSAKEDIGRYADAAGETWVRSGFWHKPNNMPQITGDRPGEGGEAICIMHRAGRKRWNGGGRAAFWSFNVEHHDRVHATQKPIGLMMKLVQDFTDPGDLVLDTHCGSGTTGVACMRLGRRFLGIEVDPAMAETARERLRAEERMVGVVSTRAGQGALFQ